jgi:hypothetical protein
MNIPNQAVPVARQISSTSRSNSRQRGIEASRFDVATEFNRIFGRRGTCSCETEFNLLGDINTITTNKCKRGFSPQCKGGFCSCERRT